MLTVLAFHIHWTIDVIAALMIGHWVWFVIGYVYQPVDNCAAKFFRFFGLEVTLRTEDEKKKIN